MSKKESNFMPVGTVRPPAPITTDNSAVIATLEKRVEELEAQLKAERAAVWKLIDESRQQQARIAELEFKVKLGDDFKERAHYVAKAIQAAWEERVAELDAENQRLRVALDRYRGQIDRFGTESAGEALQEQEK